MPPLLTVKWHCTDCEKAFDAYINIFISHFGSGQKPDDVQAQGIVGRILRGTNSADFDTLADNPQRRIVFLLDSAALLDLLGLTGREMLQQIGYPQAYIDNLLIQQTQFKLVVLPAIAAKLATWDNLLNLTAKTYPYWRIKIEQARPILRTQTYRQIMAQSSDAAEVRRFLAETINVNPLFAGDGYTRREQDISKPVYAEYVTVNKPLTDFGGFALINIPVESNPKY